MSAIRLALLAASAARRLDVRTLALLARLSLASAAEVRRARACVLMPALAARGPRLFPTERAGAPLVALAYAALAAVGLTDSSRANAAAATEDRSLARGDFGALLAVAVRAGARAYRASTPLAAPALDALMAALAASACGFHDAHAFVDASLHERLFARPMRAYMAQLGPAPSALSREGRLFACAMRFMDGRAARQQQPDSYVPEGAPLRENYGFLRTCLAPAPAASALECFWARREDARAHYLHNQHLLRHLVVMPLTASCQLVYYCDEAGPPSGAATAAAAAAWTFNRLRPRLGAAARLPSALASISALEPALETHWQLLAHWRRRGDNSTTLAWTSAALAARDCLAGTLRCRLLGLLATMRHRDAAFFARIARDVCEAPPRLYVNDERVLRRLLCEPPPPPPPSSSAKVAALAAKITGKRLRLE